MRSQDQTSPHPSFAVQSGANAYSPGVGSLATHSRAREHRSSLVQRSLRLLRQSARKPLIVGAVAMAVAYPLVAGSLRRPTPKASASRHPSRRRDDKLSLISAGWNAFVLIRNLQRRSERAAERRADSSSKLDVPPRTAEEAQPPTASRGRKHRINLKSIYVLLKASVSNWVEDFAPSMGAALSYYTVFSIAPLLVIVIAVAALVFGQSEAQTAILDQISGLVGPEGASAIKSMLASAQKPKEGAISSALSVVMLLIGATTVFSELESDLNRIWRVPASKQSGIWKLLRTRVLSLGLVVTIGFLLLVSLVANAALAAWGKYWSGWFFGVEVALQAANLVLSLAVFTLLFALMFKILPRVKIAWRDVWIGAAVTALLFSVGKFLIGMYIGKTSVASSYGAAGALVVLLVWVYYSSQVFLLGAEFTRAYAESHGSRKAKPSAGPTAVEAQRVKSEAAPVSA